MDDDVKNARLLQLTATIVSAHVAHNTLSMEALPALVQSVYASLAGAGQEAKQAAQAEPAVPVRKSVFPDYIICLENGKKLKTLKRHLATAFGMTPEQYREKWGLPKDYPMVAPNYAKQRSALAKHIRLGRKPEEPAPEPVADVPVTKVRASARGRKKAA